ncbi:DUF3883 domain-containing protein [Bradyrhizobium sp.]|uniref:DUF3883 domain-containing protein n=1 Tax=Bradyrhizobium sp. TaxID=376 RepID=UPI0025C1DB02|nr:DUF3883 domain-containing protein [Bradyrhizobium sp.]
MADEEKIGKPWNDDELDAIVVDYFSMLNAELSRQPYIKSHHSAVLMKQIGRTHRSVEFKHQNISAVLEEMGLPWIAGYKPKRNYQASIFGAIDRYLSSNEELVYHQLPPKVLAVAEDAGTFVDVPKLGFQSDRPWQLERLVRKFDAVERDLRNRSLGRAGEEFVLEIERKKLEKFQRPDLSKKIRWVSSEEGDGAGYDILSFQPDGRELLIEVKTTNGAARTPFFISENECQRAAASAESWRLYRVHLFAQNPRIFQIAPPLNEALNLRPDIWRASFS